MAKVSLRKVNKVFPGGVQAVNDVNLEVADKEFLVLVGPSDVVVPGRAQGAVGRPRDAGVEREGQLPPAVLFREKLVRTVAARDDEPVDENFVADAQ